MKEQGIRSNMWRWYCGGSVIGIAVVIGCASAVDFKESGREAGFAHSSPKPAAGVSVTKKSVESSNASLDAVTKDPAQRVKRGIAVQRDEPHNGGKMVMPIEATFDDGNFTQVITRDKVVIISLTAGAEIKSLQGLIEGTEGLEGAVRQPLDFSAMQAGENQLIGVAIPAKSGSLIVRLSGMVNGQPMSANLDLKIKNPKEVGAASVNKPLDMQNGVVQDATGQLIQPMTATER